MTSRPFPPVVGVVLALVVGLAGCTGPGDTAPPPSAPETTSAPDGAPDGGTPDASPDGTPGRPSTDAPRPRRTEPPPWVTRPSLTRPPAPGATAPAAGEDIRRAFPRPADLGPSWTYRESLGQGTYAEPGVVVLLPNPRDALRTAMPRGCRPPRGGPDVAPLRATSVAYEVAGDWVDATRLRFETPRGATRFLAARRAALRACVDRGTGSAVGPRVTRVVDLDAGSLLSDRTPESDAYSDVTVVDGDTAVLVSRRSDDRPTLRAARALAAAFTGARVPGGIS